VTALPAVLTGLPAVLTGLPAMVTALVLLAALDGMFAGFRSSCGRTGLIRHRRADLVAHLRGLALAVLLLAPVAVIAGLDAARHPARRAAYQAAGRAMLAVYLPFALLVLAALTAYLLLGWRRRFLASALVLGPATAARPLVGLLGAAVAARAADDLLVAALAVAAVTAALAVEPCADRRWYARPVRR